MALTPKETISIVQIIVYCPCALLAFFQVVRYHIHRGLAWISLFGFCSVRIVGAALYIKNQSETDVSPGSLRTTLIIQSVGVSPLMLAVAGFLGLIERHARLPHANQRLAIHVMTHQLVIVAVVLSIFGGLKLTDVQTLHEGITLRKIGAILFLSLFISLAMGHAYCWRNREKICPNRVKLLIVSTAVLPFFFVRILESVISAFSSLESGFGAFNPSLAVYATMAVTMEFIIVLIYVVACSIMPLDVHWPGEIDDAPYAMKGNYSKYGDGEGNTGKYM